MFNILFTSWRVYLKIMLQTISLKKLMLKIVRIVYMQCMFIKTVTGTSLSVCKSESKFHWRSLSPDIHSFYFPIWIRFIVYEFVSLFSFLDVVFVRLLLFFVVVACVCLCYICAYLFIFVFLWVLFVCV